jgi:hypothetical protein
VGATAIGVLVAIMASIAARDVYRGTAHVKLDQTTIFYAFTGLDNQFAYPQDPAEIATDPRVLARAVAEAGLNESADALLASSSVRQAGDDTSTIVITVDHGDPRLARRLVNAYARAYARAVWAQDAAAARRVLRASKDRVWLVRHSRSPQSEREFAEHALALVKAMPHTPTAVPVPSQATVLVWPRPLLSGFLAATLSLLFALGVGLLIPEVHDPVEGRAGIRTAAISFVGALVLGAGSVWTQGSAARAMGLSALASIPFLAALAGLALPLLAVIVVFAQVFEGYEFRTPVVTLSIGVVALLLLLVFVRNELRTLFRDRLALFLGVSVAVLVGSHLLQIFDVSARIALRGLVAATGIALFWLAGLYLARQTWGMTAVGIGAALALLVLGVAAIGVGTHVLPQSNVLSGGRTFVGLQSPFPRTYGLAVGGLPSTFLPLTIPWLTLVGLDAEKRRARTVALATIAVLFVLALLFFQTRSMLLQIVVGVVLTAVAFRGAAWQRLLGLGGLAAAAAFAIPSLLFATDRLSTDDRWASYRLALEFFREHPRAILVGTDPSALAAEIDARLVPPLPAAAPIHNMFIQFLAEGGILAAIGASAMLLVPLAAWTIVAIRTRTAFVRVEAAWIPAAWTMMAIDFFSYPLIGNGGNAWLGFGMLAGYSVTLWAWSSQTQRSTAQTRETPASVAR